MPSGALLACSGIEQGGSRMVWPTAPVRPRPHSYARLGPSNNSVIFFESDDSGGGGALPSGRDIAIPARIFVKTPSICSWRHQVRPYLGLPKIEAVVLKCPAQGFTDVSNHEARTALQQQNNFRLAQPSQALRIEDTLVVPNLDERRASDDSPRRVYGSPRTFNRFELRSYAAPTTAPPLSELHPSSDSHGCAISYHGSPRRGEPE